MLCSADIVGCQGRAIDADVHVGGGNTPCPLASFGFTPPGGLYLPDNLPPRIGPRPVGNLYRVAGRSNSASDWTSQYTAWTRWVPSAPVPEDAPACRANHLDHRRRSAHAQSPDASAAGRCAAAAKRRFTRASGVAAGGLLSGLADAFNPGGPSHAALGQDTPPSSPTLVKIQLASSAMRSLDQLRGWTPQPMVGVISQPDMKAVASVDSYGRRAFGIK